MTLLDFAEIIAILVMLAIGNFAFEKAARSLPKINSPSSIMKLAVHPYVWIGGFFFAAPTILYISMLQRVSLAQIYPIMSINYVAVPLIALTLRREKPNRRFIIGMAMLVVGLALIVTD